MAKQSVASSTTQTDSNKGAKMTIHVTRNATEAGRTLRGEMKEGKRIFVIFTPPGTYLDHQAFMSDVLDGEDIMDINARNSAVRERQLEECVREHNSGIIVIHHGWWLTKRERTAIGRFTRRDGARVFIFRSEELDPKRHWEAASRDRVQVFRIESPAFARRTRAKASEASA